MSVVYTSSHKADIRRCEERLTTTVEFIKDQTDSYVNYNNIAVAKSLMRGSTVIRTLEEISLDCSEAELEAYADKLWLTGISVLNQQGKSGASTRSTASAMPGSGPIWNGRRSLTSSTIPRRPM